VGERTAIATRLATGAQGGTEIHHGLIVGTDPGLWGAGLRQYPQAAQYGAAAGPAGDCEAAGQDPLCVAVQDGVTLTEGEGQNRPGSGTPDPRESPDLSDVVRKAPAVVGNDEARGPVQVPGAGVITETRPQVQDLVQVRRGQVRHGGKTGQKALEIREDDGNLGLLEHDLRDPHPIGSRVPLPGQVLAAMPVEPGQQGTCYPVSLHLDAIKLSVIGNVCCCLSFRVQREILVPTEEESRAHATRLIRKISPFGRDDSLSVTRQLLKRKRRTGQIGANQFSSSRSISIAPWITAMTSI